MDPRYPRKSNVALDLYLPLVLVRDSTSLLWFARR